MFFTFYPLLLGLLFLQTLYSSVLLLVLSFPFANYSFNFAHCLLQFITLEYLCFLFTFQCAFCFWIIYFFSIYHFFLLCQSLFIFFIFLWLIFDKILLFILGKCPKFIIYILIILFIFDTSLEIIFVQATNGKSTSKAYIHINFYPGFFVFFLFHKRKKMPARHKGKKRDYFSAYV